MLKKIVAFMIVICTVSSMTVYANLAVTISAIKYSDDDYIFRIKGSNQEFILLDEGTKSDSKFLVMAKGYYGKVVYHAGGGSKFDPENPQSMAYFLNNDFLKFGNRSTFTLKYYKLPQQMIEHIDMEHIWECEHGKTGSEADDEYTIKCGVVIPSQTELLKYADKIGWDDDFTSRENDASIPAWGVRSTFNHGELMAVRPNTNMDKLTSYGYTTNAIGIRPIFWIDSDFFKEVRLDLPNTGKKVFDLFKYHYTIDELINVYSLQECYDYLGYGSPLDISIDENNLISIKNNRSEDIHGLMLTIFYDEGHYPIKQTYEPVYIKADSRVTVEKSATDSAGAYQKVKIIGKKMPYNVLSNSVYLEEVKQ